MERLCDFLEIKALLKSSTCIYDYSGTISADRRLELFRRAVGTISSRVSAAPPPMTRPLSLPQCHRAFGLSAP